MFALTVHKGHSNYLRPHLLHLVSLRKHQWVSKYEKQKANQTVRMYSYFPKRKTTEFSCSSICGAWTGLVSSCNKSRRDSKTVSLHFKMNWFKKQIHSVDTAVPFKSHHTLSKMLVSWNIIFSSQRMFLDRHHLYSEGKGLTKKTMVVGRLLFSRLNGLLEKHAFCRLVHL